MSGKDQFIKFERVVDRAKKIPPKFAPRADKAHYSDTNWQLLQKIVETITSQTIVDLFQQYIFDPLDLKKTYVFLDVNDTRPIHLYYKKAPLYIPKAISGFNADGGIVSTSQESVQFLKAFSRKFSKNGGSSFFLLIFLTVSKLKPFSNSSVSISVVKPYL